MGETNMFTIEKLYNNTEKTFAYKTYPFSIVVVKPNEKFREWIKKLATNLNIEPSELEQLMQPSVLDEHKIAILSPMIRSTDEFMKYLQAQSKAIFDRVLKTWNVDLKEWPEERDEKTLCTYFTIKMYSLLCGITTDTQLTPSSQQFSVIAEVRARQPYIDWCTSIKANKNIQKRGRALQKIDTNSTLLCYLCHSSQDLGVTEWKDLLQKNFIELARMWMYMGCNDQSLWPTWNDYSTFTKWFNLCVYLNTMDLSEEKKEENL